MTRILSFATEVKALRYVGSVNHFTFDVAFFVGSLRRLAILSTNGENLLPESSISTFVSTLLPRLELLSINGVNLAQWIPHLEPLPLLCNLELDSIRGTPQEFRTFNSVFSACLAIQKLKLHFHPHQHVVDEDFAFAFRESSSTLHRLSELSISAELGPATVQGESETRA